MNETQDQNQNQPPTVNLPAHYHFEVPRWIAFSVILIFTLLGSYLVWARANLAWPYDDEFLPYPERRRERPVLKDWKTYRNEEYGFEVKYPPLLQLDETGTLRHTLADFHFISQKDGSKLGLADDINIVFKREPVDCNNFETPLDKGGLDIRSIGISFEYGLIKGVKYETGAEGEGKIYYCIKDAVGNNIFQIERFFLNESYDLGLQKESDFISSSVQNTLTNQILSTFKFIEPKPTAGEGAFCGGIGGIQCPTGFVCGLDGDYPDAGGVCLRVAGDPGMSCLSVITRGRNTKTGEVRNFSNSCLPEGWLDINIPTN